MQMIGQIILENSDMKKIVIFLLIVIGITMLSCEDDPIVTEQNTDKLNDVEKVDFYMCDEYELLLKDYVSVVEYRLSDTFESDNNNGVKPSISENLYDQVYSDDNLGLNEKWFCMVADMTDYITTRSIDEFGYLLKDINKDNIDEMFWVDSSYNILAVFTIKDNNAVLLDAFWPKYKCVLSNDGFLYTWAIGGSKYGIYELKYLDFDVKLLEIYKSIGVEPISINGSYVDEYYKIENGKRFTISETEYNQFLSDIPFKHSIEWLNETILPLTSKLG